MKKLREIAFRSGGNCSGSLQPRSPGNDPVMVQLAGKVATEIQLAVLYSEWYLGYDMVVALSNRN